MKKGDSRKNEKKKNITIVIKHNIKSKKVKKPWPKGRTPKKRQKH